MMGEEADAMGEWEMSEAGAEAFDIEGHPPECGCRRCMSALHAGDGGRNPYLGPRGPYRRASRLNRLVSSGQQGEGA